MNITKQDIDSLNAILKVDISKEDYAPKVEKVLSDYKKNAKIAGFRVGHVPMGMVKKQYGKAVLLEEINKLIQEALHNYLTKEKLDLLGNPLPKNEMDINWEADNFVFEFELGLAPQFEVDLKAKAVTQYKVIADQEMLNNQVKSIRKQYGKLISKTIAEKGDEITGVFKNEEKEINNKTTFSLDKIKGKKQLEQLIGAKVGDVISLKTKGLFEDEHDNQTFLKVAHHDAHGLDIKVTLTIEEINKREMATLNQELFDKLFGEGIVTSEEQLKEKIKEDAEKQFEQQADQVLLNTVVESLIENTKFDLPGAFLTKWIQRGGEKDLTEEEAKEEYNRSEKGLRYQLIEGKLMAENNLIVTFEELKQFTKSMIAAQMAQYGQMTPPDEEMDGIAARILANEEEVKRLSEQLNSQKLLQFFKENAKLKVKELSYDKFVKEAY
ncbi:MAG: trigger factor [Flavobacteriaceae bacterium CG_4_8_14_3_um_filter_34_10]|nr:MAG: trigger factor [Flavobacteriaceae bacterium CG2_30_34_30]PIX10637.1 MAG: trigger factor [Flavobacteriaceae bacterium CG_4_8_14_3_um_filter_34_10]